MSRNTISFWLRSVISMAHASALKEDCRSLRSELTNSGRLRSLLFKRNCAVQQALKAGTWSAQSTFSAFYLRDVTYWHLDTFSIGTVVATQQVMSPASPFGSGVVTLDIFLFVTMILVPPRYPYALHCDVSSSAASSLLSFTFD